MNLAVKRFAFSPFSVIGRLEIDGQFHCYTLEPPWKEDGSKPRAIPEGAYRLVDGWSEKHKRNVPHVQNVPGFEAIEIHPGNFPKDTEGCTLVGMTYTGTPPDFIGASRLAFDDLYETLKQEWRAGRIIGITYINLKGKDNA